MRVSLLRDSKPSREGTVSEIAYVQRALALVARREREKAKELRKWADASEAHAQHVSRALTAFTRLVKKGAWKGVRNDTSEGQKE